MSTKFKVMILLTFLFVISSSNLNAQSTIKSDSTKSFSITELKLISNYLIELEARRTRNELDAKEIEMYKSIIDNYKNKEDFYKQKENNYNKIIGLYEQSSHPWYDRFMYGVPVGVVVTIGIILLSK